MRTSCRSILAKIPQKASGQRSGRQFTTYGTARTPRCIPDCPEVIRRSRKQPFSLAISKLARPRALVSRRRYASSRSLTANAKRNATAQSPALQAQSVTDAKGRVVTAEAEAAHRFGREQIPVSILVLKFLPLGRLSQQTTFPNTNKKRSNQYPALFVTYLVIQYRIRLCTFPHRLKNVADGRQRYPRSTLYLR